MLLQVPRTWPKLITLGGSLFKNDKPRDVQLALVRDPQGSLQRKPNPRLVRLTESATKWTHAHYFLGHDGHNFARDGVV